MSLQEQFSPGTRVQGRYVIQRLLGVGGFAAVFEAHDEQMDRLVALKILNIPSFPDENARARFLERFEREAKLAARVDHPNCINVFDYGTCEKPVLPFIVMERLDGEDLGDYLAEHGPMAPARLLPMFIGALHALGFAHEQGIVHKDLKPSNLFVKYPGTRRESLCIVDFGIAHLQDVTTRLTQTGNVVGTPHYVAPEYITEQRITPALDVYQMGLILIESLQGKQVVQASDSLVAMFQHVNGNLTAPTRLMRTPLGPVLQKALAWNPDERYPDAFAFADALEAVDPSALPALGADEPQIELRSTESREQIAQAIARVTGPTPATPVAPAAPAAPAVSATPAPITLPESAVEPLRARATNAAPTVEHRPDPPARTSPWRTLGITVGVALGLFFVMMGLIVIVALMADPALLNDTPDQGTPARGEAVDMATKSAPPDAPPAEPDLDAQVAAASDTLHRATTSALTASRDAKPTIGVITPDGGKIAVKLPVKPAPKKTPRPPSKLQQLQLKKPPKPPATKPAAKLSNEDLAMHLMLAQQALIKGDYGSALRECEIPSQQGYAPCHNITINAALKRGDTPRACAASKRALRQNPASRQAEQYRALITRLSCK